MYTCWSKRWTYTISQSGISWFVLKTGGCKWYAENNFYATYQFSISLKYGKRKTTTKKTIGKGNSIKQYVNGSCLLVIMNFTVSALAASRCEGKPVHLFMFCRFSNSWSYTSKSILIYYFPTFVAIFFFLFFFNKEKTLYELTSIFCCSF